MFEKRESSFRCQEFNEHKIKTYTNNIIIRLKKEIAGFILTPYNTSLKKASLKT